ncbi:MAG: hypothetical protein SFV55_13140 [Haliscomenobacter sp.]|uniref:hypothetical protein n=1 Tax=Haliscomenobacter sp. TaxID=2717303 RepID=UPI0029BBBF3D|nr:hypothetical protein [Haliscomenobacter sp.]MDX2069364.1 hypothetical protein [Haliscomenobacter sp.]
MSSTTAVVAANLTQLFTPDDRGYSKFNRSAIRFMPGFDFSKIGMTNYCATFVSFVLICRFSLLRSKILPQPYAIG